MNTKRLIITLAFAAVLPCALRAQEVVRDTVGLARSAVVLPEEMLLGSLPGIRVTSTDGNPDNSPVLTLRGMNSLYGESTPLLVLDGVVLNSSATGALGFLQPDDISSFTVLKGPAASAGYGRLGANGVIVINTLRPQTQDMSFDWKSSMDVSFVGSKTGGFRPGVGQRHRASIGKSSGGSSYNASLWFRQESYTLKGTGNLYGGLSFRYETSAHPIFHFSVSSVSSIGRRSAAAGVAEYGLPSTMMLLRDASVWSDDTPEGWLSDYDNDVRDIRSVNELAMKVNFLPGFHARLSGGADFQKLNRDVWYGAGTSIGALMNGAAELSSASLLSYEGRLTLVFDRYFKQLHHLDINVFGSIYGENNSYNTMTGSDFFTHVLRAGGLGLKGSKDPVMSFRHNHLNFAAGVVADYDYDGAAGIKASLRADFCPRYDDAVPALFPTVNVYADLQKLLFRDSRAVSELKVDFGYGKAGRDSYYPYEMTVEHVTGKFPEVVLDGAVFHDGMNRLVSDEFEAGLGMGFLSGRLKFVARYFDRFTRNDYKIYCFGAHGTSYWAEAARTEAFGTFATLTSKGVELSLSAVPVRTEDWNLSIGMTATYDSNLIDFAPADSYRGAGVGEIGFMNANLSGNPPACLLGYRTDGDGLPSGSRVLLGNTLPQYLGSMNLTLKYKDFCLDLLCDGAFGLNKANLNAMIADGAMFLMDRYVEDGDFVRLSRVSLGYEFNSFRRALKSLSLYLSGGNLLVLSKYSGWNPDVNCYGLNGLTAGLDYGSFPVQSSVTLGVKLKF